jgi:hypothetical protein
VIVLKPDLISERDFTEGKAVELVGEIVSLGARSAMSVDEIVHIVEEISQG